MVKISKLSMIISIALVCAMIFGSGAALGSFVTTFDGTTPPSSETNVTFKDGGGSGEASITMPTIGVAVGSVLTLNGGASNETHFTDYRREKAPDLKYNGNYYHDFPPTNSQYNPTELLVNETGASLRKYSGTYTPDFSLWNYVDNTSTTANVLLDDANDQRIVAGNDGTKTTYIPGPGAGTYDCNYCEGSGKYTGSASKTYFPDGRFFKSFSARVDANTLNYGSYYAPVATIKAWDVSLKDWVPLVDQLILPAGSINDYPIFSGSWTTPKYSQIQVNVSTAYSWSSYYWVGFEAIGSVQGYASSSTFISQGVDTSIAGSMVKGWAAWNPSWAINNATIVPDEIHAGVGGGAAGTSIDYYLSADNGSHWEQASEKVSYQFTYPGHILRWKAVLSTTSNDETPAINQVLIKINRLYSLSQVFTAGKFNTKWPITAIQPMLNGSRPTGTDLALSVSNDNGTTWKSIENRAWAILPWNTDDGIKNTELKWKAELKSSDGTLSPYLQNITLNYVMSMYPLNVIVKIGELPEPLWQHKGYLLDTDGVLAIDGDQLVIDLNYILPHLGTDTMKISLNVTSASAGVVHFSSLSVEYGLPPVLAQDIPTQVIDEDSGSHTKLVNLENYFTDDFDDGKLSFEIPFQEDPSKVRAWIEEKHFLSIETVKKDWFGQVRFVVRAIDNSGLKTQSNTFTIQVQNVNDPPVLNQVPDFRLTVGELFEYQLQWSDPDPDTWTFTIAPPVLNLDATTGKISTTPDKTKIGEYNVTYTITDKAGSSDTKQGLVEITNKNSAPKLDQIGPQFLTVNTAYTVKATATDPDLEFKTEVLTFSLKFEDLAKPVGMTINPLTGVITWNPTKAGTYWATIIVTDKSGASNSEFVTFTVEKVNTKPHDLKITSPSDGATANTTSVLSFSAVATDEDISDRVTFTWYDGETQFGVGDSFRTVLTTAKDHTIKVVATDGKPGHEVSTTIIVRVTQAPAQHITTTKAQSEKSIVTGVPDSLMFLMVLLVAVIVVAVIATIYGRGGGTRQKLKALEAEMKGTGPQAPQQPQSPPK